MAIAVTKAAGITYSGTASDVNEDCILKLDDRGIFAVADGAHGADGAERAIATLRRSTVVLDECLAAIETDRSPAARLAVGRCFERIFRRAGDMVRSCAERTGQQGLSSTMTAVVFAERYAFIAHVGHSRAYRCRAGEIWQVTSDDIVDDEARTLTQALGVTPRPDVAFAEVLLNPGDVILLCSDGLTQAVDDDTIRHVLETETVDTAVHRLITLACDGGSADNISVIAIDTGHGTVREAPRVDVAATIRDVFLFRGMQEADRMRVAPYLEEVNFAADQPICVEGEPGSDFYIIISGEVVVSRDGVTLTTIGSGGHFGEISLIRDGLRTATVTASEATLAYRLSREQFRQLVLTKPDIGVRMTIPLLDQMAARVGDLTERLVTTSEKPAPKPRVRARGARRSP